MKKILLLLAAIFLIAGCEQFSTTYQRIDDAEFRMLDFMYEPADASPGDTVTLTAVFAGKNIDLDKDIDWYISFNVVRDIIFGETKALDSSRLEKYRVNSPTQFSEKTQTVAFKIPIPQNIMRDSRQIPERWTDMLPPSTLAAIPAEFASMSKTRIIDTLESFLKNPDVSGLSAQSAEYLPRLLQVFSVPIRVAANINGAGKLPRHSIHAIRSYQIIRYNNSLKSAGVKGIPINRNPVIDSIVVYKVEGKNIMFFDGKSDRKYTATRLDGRKDTAAVVVEDGYTYFLGAFSDGSIDTSLTMSGIPAAEKHYSYRQFQLDGKETSGVHHSEYMDISAGMGDGLATLTPPANRAIKNFTLWVTVKDEVTGELNTPDASTLKEVSGRFEYK